MGTTSGSEECYISPMGEHVEEQLTALVKELTERGKVRKLSDEEMVALDHCTLCISAIPMYKESLSLLYKIAGNYLRLHGKI